jgi:hypothetical protein
MGVYIDSFEKLGEGFYERASLLNTDGLCELADRLRVDISGCPDTDQHSWLKQRIIDELSGRR